jgi:acetylglutamate kinase
MVTRHFDRELVIGALRQALPYIRLFRGRVFVVKIGGAMCGDPAVLRDLAQQLGVLCELGIRVVLVHGGGPQTTAVSERLGLTTTFVDGRRVTSPETLDVAIMTMNGSVNTAILAACRASQVAAIGVSGVDAGLVKAVRRPPQTREVDGESRTVDFGLVGDVTAVDPSVITRLLDAQLVPVVSPLAADDQGQVLNVNADTVASSLARALAAEKLVFLTDTPGLLEDRKNPGSLVSYTDVAGLDAFEKRGIIDGGMLPKVKAAKLALQGGVKRVHMVGYKGVSSLLIEVFTNEGAGTLIVRDTAELLPAEHDVASKGAS